MELGSSVGSERGGRATLKDGRRRASIAVVPSIALAGARLVAWLTVGTELDCVGGCSYLRHPTRGEVFASLDTAGMAV